MSFEIAPTASCCVVDDQVIFLDLANNAYVMSPTPVNSILLDAIRHESPGLLDREPLQPLISSGILIPASSRSGLRNLKPCSAISPNQSVLDTQRQCRPNEILKAVISQIEAAIVLKVGKTAGALDYLRRARTLSCRSNKGSVAPFDVLSWASLLAPMFVPSRAKCLRRSLGLALILARAGVVCDLVIGVRLNTFAAHAWVQIGDLVLNDSVDEVLRYTPILVF